MLRRAFLALIGLGLLTGASLAAHRQHVAISTVEWNARLERVEITHRMYLHDIEELLLRGGLGSLRDDEALRARAAAYTALNFELMNAAGAAYELETLGGEVDGDLFFVYQILETDAPPAELAVRSAILQDLHDDQTNHVNLDMGGEIRTLIFKKGDRARVAGRLL